jgi:hypothetical protein
MPAVRRSALFLGGKRFLSGSGPQQTAKARYSRFQKVLIGTGIGCTGAVALAALPPGEGLPDSPLERMKTRFAAMHRGSLAFGVCGLVMADYKYSLSGLMRGSEEYREALSSCHRLVQFCQDMLSSLVSFFHSFSHLRRAARRLLDLCRRQAGVYIKAGQHLSSLRPAIPSEFTDTLSTLHDDAPQSSMHDVKRVMKEDMGVEKDDLFQWFEPIPLGCASLAQVQFHTVAVNNLFLFLCCTQPSEDSRATAMISAQSHDSSGSNCNPLRLP